MDRLHKSRTAILILFYLYTINCQSHMENVALTGTCSMTARFPQTGNCTEAIDNDISLDLGFGNTPNCIHTTDSLFIGCLPFWQVVLKEEYTITNITIFNRIDSRVRLTYTNVTVNNTLCKSFGSDVSTIQDINTFQCSSPIRGSTVIISRHYPTCTRDGDFILSLCEVQVWVCSKGWYGNDCNTPCGDHCSNNATCDRYDGSCPKGCIIGWYGSRCDDTCPQNCKGACNQSSGACFECNGKYYGRNCTETCGNCAEHGNCELTNGYCTECELGWEPPLCQKACNDTHYGQNCREECGLCFGKAACNKATGECLKCEPGRGLPLCQKVCSNGWYGSDCNSPCSVHCNNSVTCNRYDGSCPQGCIIGWHGSRCDNSCPLNCVGACNQISGTCFGQSNSDGSAVGAIVGSIIGIVVVLSAVVLLTLVYRWRRNSLRKQSTGSSVRPSFDADHLQVQYLSGHKEEEIHCQDVQCLNSTYETLDRNALYQNTKELSVYSQLSINKQNNQ